MLLAQPQPDHRAGAITQPDLLDSGGKHVQRRDSARAFGGEHHVLRQDPQPKRGPRPGPDVGQKYRAAAGFQPGQPVFLLPRNPGEDHRPGLAQPHRRSDRGVGEQLGRRTRGRDAPGFHQNDRGGQTRHFGD